MSNTLSVTGTVSEPDSRRWLMLPVVLLAMFMAGFDIWVVNVAAPSLQRDLHVSDAALQLIVAGVHARRRYGPGRRRIWPSPACGMPGCFPLRRVRRRGP